MLTNDGHLDSVEGRLKRRRIRADFALVAACDVICSQLEDILEL